MRKRRYGSRCHRTGLLVVRSVRSDPRGIRLRAGLGELLERPGADRAAMPGANRSVEPGSFALGTGGMRGCLHSERHSLRCARVRARKRFRGAAIQHARDKRVQRGLGAENQERLASPVRASKAERGPGLSEHVATGFARAYLARLAVELHGLSRDRPSVMPITPGGSGGPYPGAYQQAGTRGAARRRGNLLRSSHCRPPRFRGRRRPARGCRLDRALAAVLARILGTAAGEFLVEVAARGYNRATSRINGVADLPEVAKRGLATARRLARGGILDCALIARSSQRRELPSASRRT